MTDNTPLGIMMLIDDDTVDHILYRRLLKRAPISATSCFFDDARTALTFLATPDCPGIELIFLDINMPSMTGFEFLEAAQREIPDVLAGIVVVMLTTSTRSDDEVRARSFPVVKDYFSKPLSLAHLVAAAALVDRSLHR